MPRLVGGPKFCFVANPGITGGRRFKSLGDVRGGLRGVRQVKGLLGGFDGLNELVRFGLCHGQGVENRDALIPGEQGGASGQSESLLAIPHLGVQVCGQQPGQLIEEHEGIRLDLQGAAKTGDGFTVFAVGLQGVARL